MDCCLLAEEGKGVEVVPGVDQVGLAPVDDRVVEVPEPDPVGDVLHRDHHHAPVEFHREVDPHLGRLQGLIRGRVHHPVHQ